MIATLCDFCGKQINGNYMHAFEKKHMDKNNPMVEVIDKEAASDICMECWKTFKDIRMIPLVKFPNTEAENE